MEVKINGLNRVPDALCSLFYLTLTACEVGIALSICRLGPRHSERKDNLLRDTQQGPGRARVVAQFSGHQSPLFTYSQSHVP